MTETMRQIAPYPHLLKALVDAFRYKPGWRAWLSDEEPGEDGSGGLRFTILSVNPDSYEPGKVSRVRHVFIVPAATYNVRSWSRWLFDRVIDVETHEAAEFARFVVDGDEKPITTRPWAPLHGPGNDPYFVYTLGSDIEQRTLQDGTVLGGPATRPNVLSIIAERVEREHS